MVAIAGMVAGVGGRLGWTGLSLALVEGVLLTAAAARAMEVRWILNARRVFLFCSEAQRRDVVRQAHGSGKVVVVGAITHNGAGTDPAAVLAYRTLVLRRSLNRLCGPAPLYGHRVSADATFVYVGATSRAGREHDGGPFTSFGPMNYALAVGGVVTPPPNALSDALVVFQLGPTGLVQVQQVDTQGAWRELVSRSARVYGTHAFGGTFVRNENWDESTDPFRKALPDSWEFREGDEDEAIYEQLFADSGDAQYAVTERRIPPTFYGRIPEAEDRYTTVESPYVDYVLPNFNRVKNLKARQAIMLALNAKGYTTAIGGDKAGVPAKSIVNPAVIGYQENPNFTAPPEGDPQSAKAMLQESGEKMPYPLKYTYQGGTPTSDKAASALAETWGKAGFKVSLDPLVETYYTVIQKPSADFDVTWGGWGADWPSIATVIPPLFDSRINLTSESNGQDYGNYKSDKVNKMIDEAALMSDVDEQAAKYIEIDDQLGKDVAYIPLEITKFYFLHGSKVTGYINNPATAGYPDLGAVGVEQ